MNNPSSEVHPLAPFLPDGARVLMLGSFPPKRVRWSMEFFYPNLQNDMWRIMGLLFFGDKAHFLADLGLVHVLAALDRDERLVGALETVGDDDLATRGIRGKAVLVGGVDVLERVFAATHIERIAVGEEGLASQLLHDIRDGAGVVGAQKAQIAQLAKVNLDGDELVLKVDLLDTGVTDEALELVELALASMRAQVGEVHLSGCCGCSCGHSYIPSVYMALQT